MRYYGTGRRSVFCTDRRGTARRTRKLRHAGSMPVKENGELTECEERTDVGVETSAQCRRKRDIYEAFREVKMFDGILI